uniref:Diacylglycerol kinase n=1 Tax=Strigamia maritima TaxID=126957 RepID=T1JKZ6_STRMM
MHCPPVSDVRSLFTSGDVDLCNKSLYVCIEVCNFVVHDRCLKTVVSPCISIASHLVKNPVAHCWTEPTHFKRKFCNVCRKRLEDSTAMKCEICDYYVHMDCQDFAVADCKECATYIPDIELQSVYHYHHWREGNLPGNSKCSGCKKTCWSAECLAGMKCEWCGITAHAVCYRNLPQECTFGNLEGIMLPPSCVSIPRTEVPMETLIGVQMRRKDARSISEEFSSSTDLKCKDMEEYQSLKEKDRDDVVIKVFDGSCALKRKLFRTITVAKTATRQQILEAALRAFHVTSDPTNFYITEALETEECDVDESSPVQQFSYKDGKRPAIIIRFKDTEVDRTYIRVFPGRLRSCRVKEIYKPVLVTSDTTVEGVIRTAVKLFGLEEINPQKYRLSETSLDKGSVTSRVMEIHEKPLEILIQLGKESVRQMDMLRFYLQLKEDPHGSNIALHVGNLPPNLSQRQYEKILLEYVGLDNKFSSIGPIYYEYGSMVITYESPDSAVRAFYALGEATYDDKTLLVLLLPNVQPQMLPSNVQPLLIFVNVKSGGCQGSELITSFRKLLNPYQVFDLENGGPLPGLYVFRHVRDYKILVCGGDGTIGWVLQCLDNVGQDSECQSPPCAIVPLGTGNDLARVLRWGPGYTGGEDPLNILKDVIEAEEIRLDRWTVVFHSDADKVEDKSSLVQNSGTGSTSEDNTQIFVMNNYFGIGVDADLCLDFHNAREENPNKFNSRLHNKGVYVKMGLRKMVSRKTYKDLHKEIKVEVDGKVIDLPPVEGIIILNILSWGSGANPWGEEKDSQFAKPTHYDGMLELVGVTGVVHLGQIQSKLRSAIRIAQGGHIKIKLCTEMPVQVDGEPWIQNSGEVVILKSALKATMLKKIKSKIKRRNTEPSMVVSGSMQIKPDPSSMSANNNSGPF